MIQENETAQEMKLRQHLKICNALLVLILFNLEPRNLIRGNLIYTSLDMNNLIHYLLTETINTYSPGILLIPLKKTKQQTKPTDSIRQ